MDERTSTPGLGRRQLLRNGLVAAGAVALGPRLLRPTVELPALQRAAAVAPSAPAIITRAEWGADESLVRNRNRSFAPLQKAIVHHTAIDEDDPAAQIRNILWFHTQERGWADIGYHFFIDRAGRIYEGRWARDYRDGEVHSGEDAEGRIVEGAHAAGYNPGCVGVALLGNFIDENPSQAQLASAARVIAWKFGPRNIDPHGGTPYTRSNGAVEQFGNIVGHKDVVQTGCPGLMHGKLPELRSAVSALLSTGIVGYRILGSDGSLWNYGADPNFGTTYDIGDVRRNVRAGVPVRAAAGTKTGLGAWVADADGNVYTFGDAPFHGSLGGRRLNAPIIGMSVTPSGGGYWLLGRDGGIFSFGDAAFHGSTGAMRLNAPVVGMAPTPTGGGYWLVASDGGIFSFGDARFFGSTGGMRLNQPVFAMASSPDGGGYWLVARDGGVFTFGNARFLGSAVSRPGMTTATAMVSTPSGGGYWILDTAGNVHAFGDAPHFGATIGAGSRPALALVPVVRA